MTGGEQLVFAASMAASSDAGREPTIAVKAAAMAVQLMRTARATARTERAEGVVHLHSLTDDELAMLDEMTGGAP